MTNTAKPGFAQFESEDAGDVSLRCPGEPEPQRTQRDSPSETLELRMRPIHLGDLIGVGPVSIPWLISWAALRKIFRLRDGVAGRFFYPENLGIALIGNRVNPVFQIRVIP
jgi:hypothetical protein